MSVGVLFVCLGNICRSPLAEGVFSQKVAKDLISCGQIFVDSCGTCDYHEGERPHKQGIQCSIRHGMDISNYQSRPLTVEDFSKYKYIVAMDRTNFEDINRMKNHRCKDSDAKIILFMRDLITDPTQMDVPDCYYACDVDKSFEQVYSLFEEGMPRLLDMIMAEMKEM
eukprot:TRINITY_DN327_c2_g1_i1.p1 TRINITY_DN327_c2_g1~~TRINITY_DN327_c2_g1_i1.p1  ORF type:complete len:168 (-),score=34.90 TRINITY_DN327_c2_g1_i1:867-1370(-)